MFFHFLLADVAKNKASNKANLTNAKSRAAD